MNFFYGINNGLFTSEIQIPIFQNRKPKSIDISLFKGFPKNGRWIIEEIKERKINKDFFLLKGNEISNNEIYFFGYIPG